MHKLVAVLFLMSSTMAFANEKELECEFNFHDDKLGRVECDVNVEFDRHGGGAGTVAEMPRGDVDVEMRVNCRDSDSSVFRLFDRDANFFVGDDKFLIVGRDNGDVAELLIKEDHHDRSVANEGHDDIDALLRLNGGEYVRGECEFDHGGDNR